MKDNNRVYLKLNVALEALIDRWYAWSHLVSPATAALNIKGRHIGIMESYIKYPQIHKAAANNPKMLGGPFIDYSGERIEEISELLEMTKKKREKMLNFTKAISQVNKLLQNEADGHSLNTLYSKVPNELKGLIELYYDLNNRPNFRFFESLLYNTEYYDESAQSISLQLVESDNSRSFVFSTPRLNDENLIHLDMPFKNGIIDDLFKMKRIPADYTEIKEAFNISPEQESLFQSFFTKEAPSENRKYKGKGIRTRYFGHACVLLETNEISILVDPVLSYDGYETDVKRYTINDLPETIDYVLITHNHQDHVLLETLLQLRHCIKNIIVPSGSKGNLQDPSLKLMFNVIGFNNIIELDDMQSINVDNCCITAIPFLGEHSDIDVRSKAAFHVSLNNNLNVLFVADSCNIEPKIYERVHEILGDVDVIFLGMECDGAPLSWLYGPLMYNKLERSKDQSRRLAGCDYDQGMSLIKIFNPKNAFVYAMGLEPWLEFISSIKYTDESKPIIESNKLVKKCIEIGIDAERLFGEKTIEY
ncbi:L-ascorbate metabolism protein UlaG (beta-lactamase superfamily) [Nonlabens dokdonensis]|jgi:L-ascorbate metabolism protein UlaG (beta-lactamase superfamily)|uniref:Beta-lactamase domain protein n=2 Tax=Nonlabens dokdonensis TaxID=328515 RepID=L7W681_NONDD|nr:MBL fold metallo-hydrolase [Nonlabens dokdonensis]AGC75281.1 beta-lactamase domain protein [Nonlabens dokdonensis DSW-6]PZX38981.1 L-ascorbate metabolism protein UlaG (beta-lactamase superfamily) [Nonlabens dokdonensis]